MEAGVVMARSNGNSARKASARPKTSLGRNLSLVMKVRNLSPAYVQESCDLAQAQIQKWTNGSRSGEGAWDEKVDRVAKFLSNTGSSVTFDWLCYNQGAPPTDVSEYLSMTDHPKHGDIPVSEVVPIDTSWMQDAVTRARALAPDEPDWAWQTALSMGCPSETGGSAALLAAIVKAIAEYGAPPR
jgi:hypothetical protein